MALVTERLSVDPADASVYHPVIIRAAQMLREGKLVAFPTETVYGLGANALHAAAVEKIFTAKDRPAWDPLIVHVSDAEMALSLCVDVNEEFERLQRAFWPGALTLLMMKNDSLPDIVTAGGRTVGLRMPSHPVAHELIRAAGIPIAAPSANLFSRPSPTTALHVLNDLGGRIDAVIDGGRTPIGVESTVLDITQQPAVIYRPGGITREQIEAVIGPVAMFTAKEERAVQTSALPSALRSPGTGMRHYAPTAKVLLVEGRLSDLMRALREQPAAGAKIGVLVPSDWRVPELDSYVVFPWGEWGDWGQLAKRLYLALRYLDECEVEVILAPMPEDIGLGSALRDRLLKASY